MRKNTTGIGLWSKISSMIQSLNNFYTTINIDIFNSSWKMQFMSEINLPKAWRKNNYHFDIMNAPVFNSSEHFNRIHIFLLNNGFNLPDDCQYFWLCLHFSTCITRCLGKQQNYQLPKMSSLTIGHSDIDLVIESVAEHQPLVISYDLHREVYLLSLCWH